MNGALAYRIHFVLFSSKKYAGVVSISAWQPFLHGLYSKVVFAFAIGNLAVACKIMQVQVAIHNLVLHRDIVNGRPIRHNLMPIRFAPANGVTLYDSYTVLF